MNDTKKRKEGSGKPKYTTQQIEDFLAPNIVEYFEEALRNVETKKTIPFISAWGRSVDLTPEVMWEYKKKNETFGNAYKKVKQIQKECLIVGALKGIFNPTAFIFTAKNITDMRDHTKIDHTSGGKPFVLPSEIIKKNGLSQRPKKDRKRSA